MGTMSSDSEAKDIRSLSEDDNYGDDGFGGNKGANGFGRFPNNVNGHGVDLNSDLKIIGKRLNSAGRIEYLLQWTDYRNNPVSTWESAGSPTCTPTKIKEFERKVRDEEKKIKMNLQQKPDDAGACGGCAEAAKENGSSISTDSERSGPGSGSYELERINGTDNDTEGDTGSEHELLQEVDLDKKVDLVGFEKINDDHDHPRFPPCPQMPVFISNNAYQRLAECHNEKNNETGRASVATSITTVSWASDIPKLKNTKKSKNAFKRGQIPPEKILGVDKDDATGELRFLMKWRGFEGLHFVPERVANAKWPQLVIQFYKEKLQWSAPSVEVRRLH